ncbi:hypothetical protein [Azospirillum sp.]|uniref:hypothetical protein n=1 Tax=Azospirillum sp. TaxID=34012 RepID=UPI003D763A6F
MGMNTGDEAMDMDCERLPERAAAPCNTVFEPFAGNAAEKTVMGDALAIREPPDAGARA